MGQRALGKLRALSALPVELFFGTDFPSEIRCARDFVNFTGQARIKDSGIFLARIARIARNLMLWRGQQ